MSITPQFLDRLRARLNVSEIIGSRVRIQRAGREYKACCPFHKEKTPSFTINDDKQFYHCFGCGAHGDVISFVMQHDNLSFIEAVEALASKAGMEVPKSSPEEIEKARKAKSLYDLLDEVTNWYAACLHEPQNKEVLEYLQQRGLETRTLDKFRIGYAPDKQDSLLQMLKEKEFTEQQILDAGVIRQSSRGGAPYPFMRQRVIFPVADRRGRVVAFGGRILPENMRAPSHSDFTPPKYLNSSDSPVFQKGTLLYGESHARQAVGDGQDLIVVEGYTDVIACHQAGFEGAVAPLGTALTEKQIAGLWRMIPEKPKSPVICFDGDTAGLKAADRACERVMPLLESDQSVRFCFMPQGEDPDSLIKTEGKQAFQERLDAALPLVDFLWTRAISGRSFETPEARAGLEEYLEEQISHISNRSLQHYYRQVLREKLKQAFGFGKTYKANKAKGFQRGRSSDGFTKPTAPYSAVSALREKIIMAVLINHPQMLSEAEEKLENLAFYDKRLDQMRQDLIEIWSELDTGQENVTALRPMLEKNGYLPELEKVLNENTYIHAGFARPERSFDEVLEGWQDLWTLISGQKAANELKSVGRKFMNECSDEAQDHFFHLIRQQEKVVGR